jgi:hypothetical protein
LVLKFDTKDGEEYARQLQALGAVLAVPDSKDKAMFRVIRDLAKRPVHAEVEDLSKLDRIFWVDNDAASVAGLAKALDLKPVPDFVVAFFPQIVEDDLLRKERAFARRAEEDILETHFRVRRTNSGYDLVVVDQVAKERSAPPSLAEENRQLRERLRKAEEEIERLRRQLEAVRKAVENKPPADRQPAAAPFTSRPHLPPARSAAAPCLAGPAPPPAAPPRAPVPAGTSY